MKASLTAVLLTLSVSLGFAQRGDHDERPAPRVILFSGNHYTGERIELEPGEQIDDFRFQRFPSGRNANNRVSSVLIEGDAEVTLFEYRDFKGDHITLQSSSPALDRIHLVSGEEDWGNNLSSVIVREREQRGRNRGDRDRNDRDQDDRAHRGDRRDDDDRHGDAHRGDRDRDWDRNDDRHSHSPHEREWERERERQRELERQRRAEARAHERRQRETEAVVRRAYQDILGRDADPQGLQTYVGIMQDRGWDEARLRKEFERSTEYRTVTVPREITEIYRDLLEREPDPAGLRFYTDRVVRANWSFSRVRDALMRSPEYRTKQRSR